MAPTTPVGVFLLSEVNGAAAAVAEPVIEASPEEAIPSTPGESQAEPDAAAVGTPEAGTEAAAVAEEDLSFDFDQEVAKRTGTDASGTEPVKAALPGRTAAELEYDQQERDRTAINTILRESEAPFKAHLKATYGIEGEVAERLWREQERPLLQRAAAVSEMGVNNRLMQDLAAVLPKEEFEPLLANDRRYPGGRQEFLQAVRESVRAQSEAEWQAKKGKEWLPMKDAKALSDIAANRAEARTAKMHADGTYQSGQNATSKGAGGRSEDEILLDPNTPIETVTKILDRRNGQ